jgi:hypothetical protein
MEKFDHGRKYQGTGAIVPALQANHWFRTLLERW